MMNWAEFNQLEWHHPWWALLALQPLLMTLLLKLRRKQVLHYADAHLLAWVVRGSVYDRQGTWKALLHIAAWLLLACAAAGPRLALMSDSAHAAVQRHEMDIMVLLDVSPSMQARDISPQRLQRAKLELLDLLPRLQGERLGLIAYSGNAGLIMPMSRDYTALHYYLKIAEPALFEIPGTAIAGALDLAMHKLQQQKSASRAILLLTDAESSALSGPAGAAVLQAADKLKDAGIRLYILGLGTEEGSTIPQDSGHPLLSEGVEVISSLDRTGFGYLADKAEGKFVQVEDGDGDWRSLYDHGMLTLPGRKPNTENVEAWQELYAVFLIPALLLFVLGIIPFRQIKMQPQAVALLLFIFVASTDVHEAFAAEADAYTAYRNHRYTQAQALYAQQKGYDGRMGEGATAYRRKDYQYAIKQFSAALLESRNDKHREQALFNLGNSYFMAGGYRAASDAFLGVLAYAPANQDAHANLALAAGKLAEILKSDRSSEGILGRRGRDFDGAMDEEASDQPAPMEPTEDNKDRLMRAGKERAEGERARLLSGEQQGFEIAHSQTDNDIAYRAALKKLELTADKPIPLHQALIKIDAAREYAPLPEMPPW